MARFSAQKKEGEGVGVLGVLRILVAATMGCFFGCFRMKGSNSHLMSTPKEHKVSRHKNALSSLFLSDESEEDSHREQGKGRNPLPEEVDIMEMKDEARFLKACGTLLETPVEIRKFSSKWADTSARKEELSKFNSGIPSASIEKLKLEKQPDESLSTVKICEEWVSEAGSMMSTPSSCIAAGHNTRRDSISSNQISDTQNHITPQGVTASESHPSATSSISSGAFATTIQRTNKSVRFECPPDRSSFSSENSSEHPEQSGSAGNSSVSKPSPFPTPLRLTDEMQTPGTVFPAYMNNIGGGETTKIRSQYVYTVLNPIEYPLQWEESKKDEKCDSNHLIESLNPNNEATPRKDEAGLSPKVVKPHSANQDGGNCEQLSSISGENVLCGRTPGDRPILGMVAAHWNDEEEETRVSPKWWDGNGIPNSTNKYKEDQKVSWHATPFEERLEKALTEDTFISQRMPPIISGGGTQPVEFEEAEESDTASSQLESAAAAAAHLKSIVSF